MPHFSAAVVGAGLSGLALALALKQQSIDCVIYEGRDASHNTGGGLMLTPNGLSVLQGIGIYDALVETSYSFDNICFQLGSTGDIVETIEYGNLSKYGMHALRASRWNVLDHLLVEVRRQSIPIYYNRRFSHVLLETEEEVCWQFPDGSSASASMLVGAGGIHSEVRKYLVPGSVPAFRGIVTFVASIPTAQLGLPVEDLKKLNDSTNKHPLPGGIIVPQLGAFVSAPQTKTGDELMITVMRRFPEKPEH